MKNGDYIEPFEEDRELLYAASDIEYFERDAVKIDGKAYQVIDVEYVADPVDRYFLTLEQLKGEEA